MHPSLLLSVRHLNFLAVLHIKLKFVVYFKRGICEFIFFIHFSGIVGKTSSLSRRLLIAGGGGFRRADDIPRGRLPHAGTRGAAYRPALPAHRCKSSHFVTAVSYVQINCGRSDSSEHTESEKANASRPMFWNRLEE